MSRYGQYVVVEFDSLCLTDTTQFIRYLNIPYCSLYDLGYTSLGGTTDTHPNPKLEQQPPAQQASQVTSENGTSKPKFRPAYELIDDYEERLGRDK
jgi:FAD synthetase